MEPLISAAELAELGTAVTILDVRWSLAGGADRAAYRDSHIPSAAFVDLDADLAGPVGDGHAGRHPLPTAEAFTTAMQRAGVCAARRVVVYDTADSMSAARAWWLLRYFGHREVQVLDGGFAAWRAAGQPVEVGGPVMNAEATSALGDFVAVAGGMPTLTATEAAELAADPDALLVDARAGVRFRGENEPVDPVAGHIPGAVSAPTSTYVNGRGAFFSHEILADALAARGLRPGRTMGVYCGSGVTAAHTVLAAAAAGIDGIALYPGSWSEWCSDPGRPVATGG